MKAQIVDVVRVVSFNRVRGQRFGDGFQPSLRWWWTPWTARFNHSGWVFLSPSWLRRFWNGDRAPSPPEPAS